MPNPIIFLTQHFAPCNHSAINIGCEISPMQKYTVAPAGRCSSAIRSHGQTSKVVQSKQAYIGPYWVAIRAVSVYHLAPKSIFQRRVSLFHTSSAVTFFCSLSFIFYPTIERLLLPKLQGSGDRIDIDIDTAFYQHSASSAAKYVIGRPHKSFPYHASTALLATFTKLLTGKSTNHARKRFQYIEGYDHN